MDEDDNKRLTISNESAKVEAWKNLTRIVGEREEQIFERREKDLNNLLVYVRPQHYKTKFLAIYLIVNPFCIRCFGRSLLGGIIFGCRSWISELVVPLPTTRPTDRHKRLRATHLSAARIPSDQLSIPELDDTCFG